MDNDEMSETFKSWNEGELDSFLIEISTNILKYKDDSGEFLLEKIRDSAGQKGTGMDGVGVDRYITVFVQASGQPSLLSSMACLSP
jgi:6-phosphogluconate dehydrogenase